MFKSYEEFYFIRIKAFASNANAPVFEIFITMAY